MVPKGSPAKTPTPMIVLEKATENCAAKSAPEERPEMEILVTSTLRRGSGGRGKAAGGGEGGEGGGRVDGVSSAATTRVGWSAMGLT